MARALSKESLINSPSFSKTAKKLYPQSIESVAERYSALTEGLKGDVRLFSASGRAELIGNHTDHNHGLVIATAIDMDVAAAAVKTGDDFIVIHSVGYPTFTVNIGDEDIKEELYGSSPALLKGILKGMKDRNRNVGGFVAKLDNRVFKGAGASSSAAFELVLCEILNELYNGGVMDFREMAIISQFAENVYFGKPSGLMDQLTAAHGGVSYMDFADVSSPVAEGLDWSFDDLELVIINCGGDHCDLTDEYAAIRRDMGEIAGYFGKKVLRDVSKDEFFSAVPQLKTKFDGRAILRAIHFFEEDERVEKALVALNGHDRESFLSLITESGNSSYDLLQNCYPIGDVKQPIPLALAIVKRDPDTIACRVHGGGFAGTVLAIIKKDAAEKYVERMKKIFGEREVFALTVRKSGATELPVR